MSTAFRTYSLLAAGVGALALATPLHAEPINYAWDGPGGETVANDIRWAGNWNPAGVPGGNDPGDVGIIGSGGFAFVTRYLDPTLPAGTEEGQRGHASNISSTAANNRVTFAGGLRVEAGGELMFDHTTNQNGYNVAFTIDGGTVSGDGSNGRHYGNITVTANGGALELGGNTESRGTINLDGGDLTLRGGATRMHGLITGTGGLIINVGGTGIRLYRDNNTYSGGTVVSSNGFLKASQGAVTGSLGTGDLEIRAGGVAEFGQANQGALNPFNGTGSTVFIRSGGRLDMNNTTGFIAEADAGGIIRMLNASTNNRSFNGQIVLNGAAFIEDDHSSTRTRTLSGSISDGSSAGVVHIRRVGVFSSNSGFLVLSGNSSYTGGTLLDDGVLVRATSTNALGAGDVTLNANANNLLVLAHDEAISAAAVLTLLENAGAHGVVELDNVNVSVLGLNLGDTSLASGTYSVGDTALGSYFTGTGSVTVVPEPASLVLLGLGTLMIGVRRSSRA